MSSRPLFVEHNALRRPYPKCLVSLDEESLNHFLDNDIFEGRKIALDEFVYDHSTRSLPATCNFQLHVQLINSFHDDAS